MINTDNHVIIFFINVFIVNIKYLKNRNYKNSNKYSFNKTLKRAEIQEINLRRKNICYNTSAHCSYK